MKTQHQKIFGRAQDYLRRVLSDQSVPKKQVLESLKALHEELSDYIVEIEEDIAYYEAQKH